MLQQVFAKDLFSDCRFSAVVASDRYVCYRGFDTLFLLQSCSIWSCTYTVPLKFPY